MDKIIKPHVNGFYGLFGIKKPDEEQSAYLSKMMVNCIGRSIRKGGLSLLDPKKRAYPSGPEVFYEDSLDQAEKYLQSQSSVACSATEFAKSIPYIIPKHILPHKKGVIMDTVLDARRDRKKEEAELKILEEDIKDARRTIESIRDAYMNCVMTALRDAYTHDKARAVFDFRFQRPLTSGDREILRQFLEEIGSSEEKIAARYRL
ncbi:MAG: hypothetical protein NT120_02935 [Candidatus Aenigmarchaeota archaeon]|nr:hypothetical protein [Candidatus Aenigmarchaeota archaeon]